MRLVLLYLLIASYAIHAARPADLQTEDLHAVQGALKKRDASLNWFRVVAKKGMDDVYSVLVVQAAPTELRPGTPKQLPVPGLTRIGVFIVSGKANRVRLLLDTFPLSGTAGFPTLEPAPPHTAYLHFYSDYGF